MSFNATIESPNYEKIGKEAGQFTSDAIALLWAALNDTRKSQRIGIRLATEMLQPKVLQVNAAASVNDLDVTGYGVVEFIGSTAQNFTGMRAPETNKSQIIVAITTGSGTITHKHNTTSETANQLDLAGAADSAQATRGAIVYCYLSSKWHEVA